MKKQLLLVMLSFFAICETQAQIRDYWSSSEASKGRVATDKVVARETYPKEYKLFRLNINPLRQELVSIVGATSKKQATIISLPNADGQIEDFEVFEASNFEPALQSKFPEIRAYSGKGITDKYATLKLAIAPNGINTTIFRTEKENEFIEVYSQDHTIYSVYKSQRGNDPSGWKCSTPEKKAVAGLNKQVANYTNQKKISGSMLRTLRLAQSCTAEYAAFFGASIANNAADKAIVLTAFNNTMTRCNGVYEKELGLHLNLIGNTTDVIYTNPATDPYQTVTDPKSPPNSWNTTLQSTLTSVIGDANYDIGHLFGASGGGGNAGCIGCVCGVIDVINAPWTDMGPGKGSGITSPATNSVNASTAFPPAGDSFDIDYVAHEIGHQLGAEHTFTNSNDDTGYPMEVGSGITIMGYAGITFADVSNHSIDTYHAGTINQLQTNLATKTCSNPIDISARNVSPNAVITGTTLTIPISTPFALDCTGTDANGDALTYSWEQMDAPSIFSSANSNATVTKADGPIFISWAPKISSTRYFPTMRSIMANSPTTGFVVNPCSTCDFGMNSEALPAVARTLNFRVTVRDNAPYVSTVGFENVGQTNFANMTVSTNASGGAFTVSSQATAGISYLVESIQTITWNKGATNAAPFNATNVDILISYDNGLTWTILLAGTPNDGAQTVTIPNPATDQTNCRIMVRSEVTNTQKSYFFDVNNNAFKITHISEAANFEFQDFGLFPNPNKGDFTVKFTSVPTNEVKVNVYDIRGRQVYEKSFSNAGTFNQNITLDQVEAGIYLVTITEGDKKATKRIIVK